MDNRTKITYLGCKILLFISFLYGFLLTREWIGLILLMCLTLTALIKIKAHFWWFPSFRLISYVAIAVVEILLKVAPYIIIASVSLALVCWEFESRFSSPNKLPDPSLRTPSESIHFFKTILAGFAGMILAVASTFIKLSLPFSAILLISLIVIYSFYQLYSLINHSVE